MEDDLAGIRNAGCENEISSSSSGLASAPARGSRKAGIAFSPTDTFRRGCGESIDSIESSCALFCLDDNLGVEERASEIVSWVLTYGTKPDSSGRT